MRVLTLFQIAKLLNSRTRIWKWNWDWTLKRKFVYGNRCFQLAFLKFWSYETKDFAFISVRYTIKFTYASVWTGDSDSTSKRKCVNGKRYFKLAYLKLWPYDDDVFAPISNRYTINFAEPVHKNCVYDGNLKRKFLYGIRYFLLAYLKFWPYENERFAFNSDRYTIKFTEPLYETELHTEVWYVNFYMGSIFPIGNFENLTRRNWR